ncbi:XP_036364214.1uncharacterized protein LOC118765797 [Octopus vulgaris]|uniref:XP_036364214.1uncharacterized protein LOC118765797 n=1 Tax=Octopus vulgaris TaxID=6645 RepID=A0AA36FFG0_OCTVU|nr:XP_036364214.1uncharacterized protein LOC118765797 [Octopus vulgaris]
MSVRLSEPVECTSDRDELACRRERFEFGGTRSTIVMVRHYNRESERATLPQDVIQQAIQQIRARVISLREASRTFGIPLKSLSRYCTKAAEANNNDHSLSGYKKPQQVLTDEFENQLEAYVLAAAEIYYGLAPKDVRKLAFQMAKAHGCNIPPTWHETEIAGEDWFSTTRIYP